MIQYISGTVQWYDLNTGRGSILGRNGSMYRIQDFTIVVCGPIQAGSLVVGFLAESSIHPILTEVRRVVPEIGGVTASWDTE